MKKTMLSTKQSYLVCFIGILAAFGIVMALCESGLADSYIKGIMMTACIAIIMTTSLNLTIGVLGQLTLGCCGFEAIGAGIAIDPTARFLLTTLIGGVVACVFGILIGIPALRLHGDYLAIITLGFGEIIRVIIQNLKVAGGMGLDKGAAGQALIGIERTANLYVVFWIMVVTVVVLFMFGRSRYGRAVKAIRDDEIAAGASGLNTTYLKVLVFAISAFFAGIAGGIFAQYIGSLNPTMAGWLNSINYVIMVVFGGMGSLTGSIVSAIGLTILPELLRAFADYRMLAYSVVLVLVMIFRPQGIFGSWEFSLPRLVNRMLFRGAAGKGANPAHPQSRTSRHHLRWSESRVQLQHDHQQGRTHWPDRPQRRRQDHGVQPADRRVQAHRRRVLAGRNPDERQEDLSGRACRHRPNLPEHPPVQAAHRRGERARRLR